MAPKSYLSYCLGGTPVSNILYVSGRPGFGWDRVTFHPSSCCVWI